MEDIIKYFPKPSFRPKQKEVLVKCHELFESGKKLILLEAPVGFGKSAVNTALCRYYSPAIYTTPQINLIEQILNDADLSPYFVEIKGRENYLCPKDYFMTSVKYGLCKREKDVNCDKTKECPYYRQKIKAISSPIALMPTAYFIVDAYNEPPNFSNRNIVIIDEGHLLSEHVSNQVKLEITSYSMPRQVYEKWKGKVKFDEFTLMQIADDVENVLNEYQTTLDNGFSLSETEAIEKIKAEEWLKKFKRFMDTIVFAEWIWKETKYGYVAEPVFSRWFMEQMVWSRGNMFVVSTATIIKPEVWVKENGADLVFENSEIAYVVVPMIIPKENRPIVDMSIGNMSHNEQEYNINNAVKMLEYIIRMHPKENIAVHFPSYELAEKFYNILKEFIDRPDSGINININNIYLPTPENRDEMLAKWLKNGGVFFAVAYHEGQDWKYEKCTVQVLAKTLYPDTTDEKVKRRLELKDFQWLMWITLIKCIQAYGRAIRAEDDKMVFYVLDSKFWELLIRNWKNVPEWIKEVVPKNRWPKKYRNTWTP